jgi:NAD(P)-dependent dehydrogenase (short-subunit alcohol dehydrogenase family)
MLADVREDRLVTVRREIGAYGVPVETHVTDVSDRGQVASLAEQTLVVFGRVDVLVNNAGIGWGGPAEVFPLDDFKRVMDVNFWGVVHGVTCFMPMMMKRRFGHIVNVSSSAGLNGMAGLSAYSASKYAVAGYTEVLRAELARHNIGVSAICPGYINTNVARDGKSTMIDGMRITHDKMITFYSRWGWSPERVARGIVSAVRHDRGVVPVGPEAWALWYLKRLSQPLWDLYMKLSVKIAF